MNAEAPSNIVDLYRQNRETLTQAGAQYELTEASINGVQQRVYKNAPNTMRELFSAGRAHGDAIFLHYEGEELSFNQFFEQVDKLSAQLQSRFDVSKGDRVAIAMRNYPEWMVAFLAAVNIGAIAVPINSWGQAAELEYALSDAGASVVFCDAQRFGYISEKLEALNIEAVVARAGSDISQPRSCNFESLLAAQANASEPDIAIDSDDLGLILYTSGTTGNPKGAYSTQANVIQAILNFECAGAYAAMSHPKFIEHMMSSGFAQVAMLAVPLFHVSGLHSMFMLGIRAGRKIIIMYKWDVQTALANIAEHKVTMLSAAPSMLAELLNHEGFSKVDTASLSGIGGGGSATAPSISNKMFKLLPQGFPGTGYGSTETNATGTTINGDAFRLKPRSSGPATPLVDLKICDENGTEMPQGERGEIWLKSASNAVGYWNRPDATAETFKDGWVLSGDVGYLDDDGFLFVVDRIKDMVIRGGENIYCVEIEALLLEHAAVAEGIAVGLPHEMLGEQLAVVVRLNSGESLDADAIKAHFAERVAKFKVPAEVWFYESEFPKNASGKVIKKQVRQELLSKLGIEDEAS